MDKWKLFEGIDGNSRSLRFVRFQEENGKLVCHTAVGVWDKKRRRVVKFKRVAAHPTEGWQPQRDKLYVGLIMPVKRDSKTFEIIYDVSPYTGLTWRENFEREILEKRADGTIWRHKDKIAVRADAGEIASFASENAEQVESAEIQEAKTASELVEFLLEEAKQRRISALEAESTIVEVEVGRDGKPIANVEKSIVFLPEGAGLVPDQHVRVKLYYVGKDDKFGCPMFSARPAETEEKIVWQVKEGKVLEIKQRTDWMSRITEEIVSARDQQQKWESSPAYQETRIVLLDNQELSYVAEYEVTPQDLLTEQVHADGAVTWEKTLDQSAAYGKVSRKLDVELQKWLIDSVRIEDACETSEFWERIAANDEICVWVEKEGKSEIVTKYMKWGDLPIWAQAAPRVARKVTFQDLNQYLDIDDFSNEERAGAEAIIARFDDIVQFILHQEEQYNHGVEEWAICGRGQNWKEFVNQFTEPYEAWDSTPLGRWERDVFFSSIRDVSHFKGRLSMLSQVVRGCRGYLDLALDIKEKWDELIELILSNY